ncbi:hypothetical protein PCANC_00484 [Puccinia coronata f. sp. avenae]|uniref:Uncharacterized protein n=1 Tax=Puccinia coronata f. sp. avenae TaxID=200324 RepID=A0A2N5W802_9BASI|nr:hypothetical protein PCANC_00484 [Puccinia coronata f. sp. avenae]
MVIVSIGRFWFWNQKRLIDAFLFMRQLDASGLGTRHVRTEVEPKRHSDALEPSLGRFLLGKRPNDGGGFQELDLWCTPTLR